MKKFLTILILTGAIFYLIMTFHYNRDYDPHYVSNALFLVGLPLFLISVMMITSATDIFISVGYSFKKIFSKDDAYVGITLHEYKQAQKEKVDLTGIAIAGILVSLIVNGVSLYLAYL
jgi:hypothetical protein